MTKTSESKGSTLAAFCNFTKQLFGAGILSLSHSFGWAGLYPGIAVYVIVSSLCIFSMVLLVQCKQHCVSKGADNVDTYPALAQHVFKSTYAYWAVSVIVIILELAFSTGWVIVATENLVVVIGHLTRRTMALCLYPIVGGLACIKFLKDLWFLSVFGFLVYIFGVMAVTYYDIAIDEDAHIAYHDYQISTVPLFVGTAMYSMEAILSVLPVEGSMRKPQEAVGMIIASTSIYGVLALVFGLVGYIYGLGVCETGGGTTITDCLPDNTTTNVIRIMLAVSLIAGYPCILYPITEIIEELIMAETSPLRRLIRAASVTSMTNPLTEDFKEPLHPKGEVTPQMSEPKRILLRLTTSLITCLIASVCTDFSKFSSVVGGLMVPVAGFLLPAAIHLILIKDSPNEFGFVARAMDWLLFVSGVFFLGIGVYSIIHHSPPPKN